MSPQKKKGSGRRRRRHHRCRDNGELKEEKQAPPNSPPVEEEEERKPKEVNAPNGKETPWFKCCQPASALVRCSRDIILLIFSYLSLQDAFKLGRNCRRLYSLYRESNKSRKSFLLLDGNPSFLNYMTINFASNNEENGQNQQELTEFHFTSRFPLSTLRLPKQEPAFGTNAIPLYHPLFVSTLPNLTYLEVVSALANNHLSTLVQALNELKLLKTLKLYLNGCQEEDDEFDQLLAAGLASTEALLHQIGSSEAETRNVLIRLMASVSSELSPPRFPVYSLSLPALKHLTLTLRSMHLFYQSLYATNGLLVTATQRRFDVKARPTTFRLLCPQLSTFRLNSADNLRNICTLVRQAICSNSKLVAGSDSVQIVLHLTKSDLNLPKARVDKAALAYISHLKVDQEMPPSISNLLPQLINLREISLTIGCAHHLDSPASLSNSYYTSVLASLSLLAHLKSVKLYFCNSQTTPIPLAPKQLAVLPSVTSLSIKYSTINHSDVVEQLSLAHCFPRLTAFACAFNQSYCCSCIYGLAGGGVFVAVLGPHYSLQDVKEEGYRMGDKVPEKLATKLLSCAQKLVRGLDKLEGVLPDKREISFFFRGKETNFSYDQINNSWSIV